LILTIGEKEKESGNLSIRTLDGKVTYGIAIEEFFSRVREHIRLRKLELEIF